MHSHQFLQIPLAALILALTLTSATAATSPFADAAAVWHLGEPATSARNGATVSVVGNVRLGVELTGAEREASLRRGGDGRVARFEGGHLRLGLPGADSIHVRGKEMTLLVRLQDPAGTWDAPILGRDDKFDKHSQILRGQTGDVHYTWQTEPAEQRINGPVKSAARYGFNSEHNDQHHLSAYRAGEFAISVLTVDDLGLVTLFHNGDKAAGVINPQKQNLGDALFRVGGKHDDNEFLEGDIAEVLVYDRVVQAPEREAMEHYLARKWEIGRRGLATAGATCPQGGLVLHLDANDVNANGGQTAVAGPLAVWRDCSPAGRNVAQKVPGRQPKLVTGVLAGKPVVRFQGHQCLDGPAVLPAGHKRFTFVAVWKRTHTTHSQVVFEQSSPGPGRRACLLTTGGLGRSQDFTDGVLRLRVPVPMIDPTRWHDVLVRFHEANLELFVDGVLVDEEWPHGALYRFCTPFLLGAAFENGQLVSGFRGQIDHVALWNRALGDAEIAALAGGHEEVAQRDLDILGPHQASLQYWKPRGYNAWAGDCMCFYQDGTFHVLYLFDRRHHQSKWGQGAHQYAHVSTKDLVHWEHHPMAVPIARQWECAMGTGDCIWHDGIYHIFYTDCGGRCEYKDKPQRGSWIFASTSTDGIHFKKDFLPIIPGGDCTVFRDPATGLFHLIRGGGNRLVSKDLRHWEETPGDFVQRKPGTTGECPAVFEWNGWFYLILGANAVWKSHSALGPWEEMKPTIYGGLYVPKVSAFTGNRRLLAGWIGAGGWGGHLVLRELIQSPDGSLGAKFPPEMIPASGQPQKLTVSSPRPNTTADGRTVTIKAGSSFQAAALDGAAKNFRLTLRVTPKPGANAFGLCLRGEGDYENGCELRFEPSRQRVQYGVPVNHGPANDATGAVSAGRDYAIEDVACLDGPFTLDIIVKDDLVDTCIDGCRTMITRRAPEPGGNRLFFFVRGGEVTFDKIVVRPLSRR